MRFATLRPLALLGLFLLPAVPARAQGESSVDDRAGLFSPEAIRKADEKIADIRTTYHRRVVVDTLRAVPAEYEAELQKKVWGSGPQKKFHELAVRRADAAGLDGIYILLYRKDGKKENPLWVEVVATSEEQGDALPGRSRNKVRETIEKQERKAGADAALLAGLDELAAELKSNAPVPESRSIGWGTIAWILGGVAALLLALFIIRVKLNAREAASGKAVPRQDTHPAHAGHLFGTPAGGWIHDQALRPPPGGENPPRA
jgi:hypothetical protein